MSRRRIAVLIVVGLLAVAGAGWAARGQLAVWRRESGLPRGDRPAILLVTLDATRADRLGAYGAKDARTPAFDALAAEGVLFEDAHAAAVLCRPTHASIFTGLFPASHGVRDDLGFALGDASPTLAERFRAAGYATAGFVSDSVLDRTSGLDRGFETFGDDLGASGKKPTASEHASSSETVYRALGWLSAARDGPVLLWVHLADTDQPGRSPPPLPELAGRPYDAAIAAADRELGRLIEGVRKRRRDAVVAVIGDHGEALGSHGEPRHGYFIYTATTRIPLVVAIPGRAARGVRVATSVRSVDVMPTLLDVAGLEAPAGLDGRSLVPLMLGRSHEPPGPVVVENMATALRYGASPLFALRRRPYLYVRAPAPELYDVTQDPGESDDASPRLPQVLADMDGELRRAMPSLPAIAGTIDPKSGVRLFQRYLDALRAHSSGRTAEAVTTYRAVLAEQPGFAIARRRLSEALVSLERYGEAEPVLAELIARGEADETTSLNLGLIRYRAKEPERALAVLRDGLQKWPRSAALRHRAGRVLMELGRPAEAVLELTESARLDPRYDDAPLALGEALESLGRKDEARAAYQAAARTSPDSDNGRRAAQALGRMAGTGASAP